jgi:hypothetical protein
MFKNFDLGAVGAVFSHLQDELSQEHAKTVRDSEEFSGEGMRLL